MGGKNDLNIYCVYSVSGTVQGLSHLVLIFDLIFTILSSTHYLSSFHSSNWGSEMLINNLPNVTRLLSGRIEIQIQVCHGLLTTTLSCHCEIIRRQHNIVLYNEGKRRGANCNYNRDSWKVSVTKTWWRLRMSQWGLRHGNLGKW